MQSVIMLSVVMLSVVMLSVVMLIVTAPGTTFTTPHFLHVSSSDSISQSVCHLRACPA
jgi:hypothetical protein